MLKTITFESIVGGRSPAIFLNGKTTFSDSVAIDPDFPLTTSSTRMGGQATPTAYAKFSSTEIDTAPIAFITSPKAARVFVVTSGGKVVYYNTSLASPTTVGTVSGSAAYGAWDGGDDYIYVTTATDVSRVGPMSGSPSITDGVWTGATLGSLTALTNNTYPTIRGQVVPQHWGHKHVDGASYFCDFKNGQGIINKIKTTYAGVNNASAYNVLDLPFGFYPVDIESYGNMLAILAFQTVNATIDQGSACLFIWNTIADTFEKQVPLPDPIATALLNANGALRIWTGNSGGGWRLSTYVGGDTVRDVYLSDDGSPPFQGAVAASGSRISFGGYATSPSQYAGAFAIGSKNVAARLGLHSIAKATSTGTNRVVTAIGYVEQAGNASPRPIMGWADSAAWGIDKYSATGTLSSELFTRWVPVPGSFTVKHLYIPLGSALAANMGLTVTVYTTNGTKSKTLRVLNSTNYANSEAYVAFQDVDLHGVGNMYVGFAWSGTVPVSVNFPVLAVIDAEYATNDTPV